MLGRLVPSKTLGVLFLAARVCRTGTLGGRDADAGFCSGLKASLMWARQDILSDIERLEGEKRGIRTLQSAFAEQKREKEFLRYKRIVEARMRRDTEVSEKRAGIEVLRVKIAEKKDEIREEEQTKDAGIRKLLDDAHQFAASEQGADRIEAARAWLKAETTRLEDCFAALRDAVDEEIRANADKMEECEKAIQCIEAEFMQIERMISDGRNAADLEFAERKIGYNRSTRTLDGLLRSHRERLAAVDGRLSRMEL